MASRPNFRPALGYRSGLEAPIGERLKARGINFKYEPFRISFVPEVKHYTPDFVFFDNGIVVETKGYFVSADRKKHLLIKAQYPDLDLRFVFARSLNKLSKKSLTTYAKWAETKGFKWADKDIPEAWLKEPPNRKSLAVIKQLMEET